MKSEKKDYHIHITAKHRWFDLKLGEVWRYRDLIMLFTKKTMTVSYKQTILGPAWLIINPLLSSVIYMVLFGRIAHLSTEGVPQILFYLTGNAIWGFFSTCLTNNSSTFVSNAGLFGKVYFPRLSVPISNVLSALIRFAIQMLLVIVFLVCFTLKGMVTPCFGEWLFLPLILLELGLLGMGFGVLISSLTTKYRDLSVLVSFCVQLWMYATPVVYPLSQLPEGRLRKLLLLNPVTAPIEQFRHAVLGVGTVNLGYGLVSMGMTVCVALLGIILFHRVERTFMDTV